MLIYADNDGTWDCSWLTMLRETHPWWRLQNSRSLKLCIRRSVERDATGNSINR